jgi:hypothetical protein
MRSNPLKIRHQPIGDGIDSDLAVVDMGMLGAAFLGQRSVLCRPSSVVRYSGLMLASLMIFAYRASSARM